MHLYLKLVYLRFTDPRLSWQRTLRQTLRQTNSSSVKDICKIFASVGIFSEFGRRTLPTKFFPNRRSCHGNEICDKMGDKLGFYKTCVLDF